MRSSSRNNLDSLCCGQAFESKGFRLQADRKADELSDALLKASQDGAHPGSLRHQPLPDADAGHPGQTAAAL